MARDHGRRREERGRGEEEHAHRTPRRMSGRHGGAVPARPARGYLRESSPRHHREHRTRCFHRCAHTHHDLLGEAQQAPGRSRRGVDHGGDREAKTRAGSSHRSPRRGGSRRIYLVEMEEGAEESSSPKVAAAELAGVGRNRQATAGRLGFRQSRAREREGKRVRESSVGWVGLTDPDPGLVGPTG
jgi:hypothetical protein